MDLMGYGQKPTDFPESINIKIPPHIRLIDVRHTLQPGNVLKKLQAQIPEGNIFPTFFCGVSMSHAHCCHPGSSCSRICGSGSKNNKSCAPDSQTTVSVPWTNEFGSWKSEIGEKTYGTIEQQAKLVAGYGTLTI